MSTPHVAPNTAISDGEPRLSSDNNKPLYATYISSMLIGIVLLIALIHVGFYKTYIRHFPEFRDIDVPGLGLRSFSAVKHFHGMMMMSWVFMLFLQPVLIRSGKLNLHRRVGRLSYILAPLVLLSIYLVVKGTYNGVLQAAGQVQARALLSLIFPAFVFFAILYFLAIRYRHNAQLHMRYMASTAFLFIPPAMDRLLLTYFNLPGYDVGSFIELSIIGAVTIFDSAKTKRLSPFMLVFCFETLHTIFWYNREGSFWQSIGGVIENLF